ncbi:hypothetical protein DFJ73DRAFT_787214 [Zopfochytrium polystomum]|nr:hypothetical protein DFJ73DRAFT_787214 [Zopfochytrium polystomum]
MAPGTSRSTYNDDDDAPNHHQGFHLALVLHTALAPSAILAQFTNTRPFSTIKKRGFCVGIPKKAQTPRTLVAVRPAGHRGRAAGAGLWKVNPNGTITSTAGLYLDNVDARNVSGNSIQLQRCNGNPAQRWRLLGNGRIANVGTGGGGSTWSHRLDAHCHEHQELSGVDHGLELFHRLPGQQPMMKLSGPWFVQVGFKFSTDGTVRSDNGLCLHNTNGQLGNGNHVQLYDCNGTPAQSGGRLQVGNKVQMWDCQNNQKWSVFSRLS